MLSRSDLQRLANREKVALGVLEKDFVLTHVLSALSRVPELSSELVFKGGTALRKVYFPHWRYSEDLDFTVKHTMEKAYLQLALERWFTQVKQIADIELATRMLHKPNGYARARIQYLGPLAYPGMIYMDLSFDEPVCLEPELRSIITSPFNEEFGKVLVYPLEELMAEKIRSLMERGKSRDYYDVWRVLKDHGTQISFEELGRVLRQKLEHKGLHPITIDEFLPADPDNVKRYWNEDLGQQVNALPAFESAIEELQNLLKTLVAPHLSFRTSFG